jgi:hypothetical protein
MPKRGDFGWQFTAKLINSMFKLQLLDLSVFVKFPFLPNPSPRQIPGQEVYQNIKH